MSMDFVRKHFGVPAKRGGRVFYRFNPFAGRYGKITSATYYLYVRFDGDKKTTPIHPKDKALTYLNREGRGHSTL